MNKVYNAFFDDFKEFQSFTERMSDIIEIINIQYTDKGGYIIFYYSTSERLIK